MPFHPDIEEIFPMRRVYILTVGRDGFYLKWIFLSGKGLEVFLKKLLNWWAYVKMFWVISIDGNWTVFCCNYEWLAIFCKMTLGRNKLELRMEYVRASFFKDIDKAAQEDVKEQNMAVCLTNQEYVRVVGMRIHGSDSSILLTHVFAKLTCNSSVFHAVYEHLSSATITILLLFIFLEACCKMRIGAVPTNITAWIIVSFSAASRWFVADCESSLQLNISIVQSP